MGSATGIEWTDSTWNPTRGCSRISPGCQACYAERLAGRFSGRGQPYEGFVQGPTDAYHGSNGRARTGVRFRWSGRVELVPEVLDVPVRWKKPRLIFVDSMSDLFHEALSNEDILAVFGAIAAAPQHIFQVLTKRADRMEAWFKWVAEEFEREKRYRVPAIVGHAAARVSNLSDAASMAPKPRHDEATKLMRVAERLHRAANDLAGVNTWPLPNVWLGVSAEDQQELERRAPHLLACPAAVRFLSCEPLLDGLGLGAILEKRESVPCPAPCRGSKIVPALSWVIVGAESGPGARLMNLRWARSIVAQCRAAGVAPFVKQLGAQPYDGETPPPGEEREVIRYRFKHPKGGDPSEWPEDLRVQEFPEATR